MNTQTVGSYRLIEKLGEGGMGEVYLAEHKYIARRAAVKFLLPELTSSPEVVSRFFSEARAASMIDHPGIVEVLDCEVHTDGRAYIVMEFLNGESLRGYFDRVRKLDGDQRGGLGICRQMTEALAAAHAQGIIHRDLKPDNVFLHLPTGRAPEEPIVKLLDFGIAKLHGGPEGGSKTRTGQLLGTPLYMSPEQCRGARLVDSRSDIYSLGCIMFEMFCGRPPFVAEGFGELIFAHIGEAPPDPLPLAPGLGAPVRQLLLRCLEKSPDKRPASMTELSALLVEVGAPEAVRLRAPVVRGRADAPGARSPVGWASPPALVATPPGLTSPRSAALAATATPPPPALTPPPAVSAPSHLRPHTVAPTTLGGGATEVGRFTASRNRPRKLMLVGASLAGLAGLLAFVMLRGHDATVAPRAGGEPSPAAAPAAEARTARAETPPPPSAPATSSITLTGLPVGATVRLDGRPTPSPLVVPRGPERHQLAIEADGFEAWEQSVDGSADRIITVSLKARPPGTAQPAKGKHRNERRRSPSHFNGFNNLY